MIRFRRADPDSVDERGHKNLAYFQVPPPSKGVGLTNPQTVSRYLGGGGTGGEG